MIETKYGWLVLAFMFGICAHADDWPRFLGPHGTGISSETDLNVDWRANPPEILWRVDLHDGGFAGPSAAEDKVFIIDHRNSEGVVRAFDLATGKALWSFSYADAAGENYGFARTTPAFDNGRLFALSRMGRVFCLNADSGAVIWQKDAIKTFGGALPRWQIAGSPILDGDQLIICVGGPDTLVALDPSSGALLWKGGNGDPMGYATPVVTQVGGERLVLAFTGTSLIGVRPGDGQVVWTHPWQTSYDVNAATPIVLPEQRVFITSGYRHGCALLQMAPSSVRVLWENKNVQAHFSTPVFYQGHIYANSDPDHLVCLDPSDGSVAWSQRGFQKGGLILADGHIFALGGRNGDLVVVEAAPSDYVEKGRITPLGGKSWTAPILCDGKLIIRNTQAMACLDVK